MLAIYLFMWNDEFSVPRLKFAPAYKGAYKMLRQQEKAILKQIAMGTRDRNKELDAIVLKKEKIPLTKGLFMTAKSIWAKFFRCC